MPGLLVDKDLLTRLTFHFSSPKERRGFQLSPSVLCIRKRWGIFGNFCLREKRGELCWAYGQMGERSCRCWKGQSNALSNATKRPCFVSSIKGKWRKKKLFLSSLPLTSMHAGRGCIALYHAWKTWLCQLQSTYVQERNWNLEKRQARNRSIDISIDRMCICSNWCNFSSSLRVPWRLWSWSHGPSFSANHDRCGTWQVRHKNNL